MTKNQKNDNINLKSGKITQTKKNSTGIWMKMSQNNIMWLIIIIRLKTKINCIDKQFWYLISLSGW